MVTNSECETRRAMPGASVRDAQFPLSRRALVVEDNALIAMEAEAQLYDLGAAAVDVAGSVSAALDLIGLRDYECALLDVSLGRETSQSVADALAAQGVAYVFTTGFGEIPWPADDRAAMPVIPKPVETGALVAAIARALSIARSQ